MLLIEKVMIYDLMGNLVRQVHNKSSIHIAELPQGTYFLKGYLENGQSFRSKVVKL